MSPNSYDANGNRTSTAGCVIGAAMNFSPTARTATLTTLRATEPPSFIDANHDGTLDAGDTDVTVYTWDARERLAKVTDYATFGGSPTEVVDYLYDVENRWIGENIDSNGDGQIDHETRFAYDGDQIVLQFDRQLPSTSGGGAGGEGGQGEGNAMTAADLSHRYFWQPNAVDQLMADEQVTTGNVVLPLTDNLGTVRDLGRYSATTGVTSVANHRVYDSFGNLQSQTNAAVDCLFGWTGRPSDNATGLQNNFNRWYDAKVGRWASEDPTDSEQETATRIGTVETRQRAERIRRDVVRCLIRRRLQICMPSWGRLKS